MRKSFIFHADSSELFQASPLSWSALAIVGVTLMTFGFVIMVYPELLLALVAGFFFFLGFLFLLFALSIRRAQRAFRSGKFSSRNLHSGTFRSPYTS